MALFRYFKRKGNSEKLPINIDCLPTQKFAPLLIQTTAKRGTSGKYTPEQKAMIGKRAAEHDVVHPRPFILAYSNL